MAARTHDSAAVVTCQRHGLGLEWEEFCFFF